MMISKSVFDNSIPSIRVGGIYFEYFIYTTCSDFVLTKICKTNNEINGCLTKFYGKFMFWVLIQLNNTQRKVTKQMNQISLLMEGCGMSVSGKRIFSKLGIGTSYGSLYNYHDNIRLRMNQHISKVISSRKGHVAWIDNFNKYYKKSGIAQGSTNLCYWTPCGISLFEKECSLDIIYDENKNPISSWPKNLFIDNSQLEALCDILVDGYHNLNFFTKCKVKEVKSFSFPLCSTSSEIINDLSEYGLKNFVPVSIMPYNITSTKGLFQVIQRLHNMYWETKDMSYVAVKVDANIYYRYVRYIFGANNPFHKVSDRFCLTLGFWHPMKVSFEKLWKKDCYLQTIFAPICHLLHPNDNIHRNMPLHSIGKTFSLLFLAYPSFRSDLLKLNEEYNVSDNNNDDEEKKNRTFSKNNLQNLVSFFEYLLPVVMEYNFALKSNDFNFVWKSFKQLLFVMYYIGCHVYVKNMIIQIIHINYLKSVEHPIYLSMKENVSSFIEEDGEISLSYLARWCSKSSLRSNRSGTENKYISIYSFMQTYHNLKSNLSISSSKRMKLSFNESTIEVVKVIQMFQSIIQQIRDEKWKFYRSTILGYKKQNYEINHLSYIDFPLIIDPSINLKKVLCKIILDMKSRFGKVDHSLYSNCITDKNEPGTVRPFSGFPENKKYCEKKKMTNKTKRKLDNQDKFISLTSKSSSSPPSADDYEILLDSSTSEEILLEESDDEKQEQSEDVTSSSEEENDDIDFDPIEHKYDDCSVKIKRKKNENKKRKF